MARPNDLAHLGDLGRSAKTPGARRLGAVRAQRRTASDPRWLLEYQKPSRGARKVRPDLPRRRYGGQWHTGPGLGLRGAEAEGEAAAMRPPRGPAPEAAPAAMQDHPDGSGRGCRHGRPLGCWGPRCWYPGRLHPGCAGRTAGTRWQVPAKPRAARRNRRTAEGGRGQPRPETRRPERRRRRHRPRITTRRRDWHSANHLAHGPHGPPASTHRGRRPQDQITMSGPGRPVQPGRRGRRGRGRKGARQPTARSQGGSNSCLSAHTAGRSHRTRRRSGCGPTQAQPIYARSADTDPPI